MGVEISEQGYAEQSLKQRCISKSGEDRQEGNIRHIKSSRATPQENQYQHVANDQITETKEFKIWRPPSIWHQQKEEGAEKPKQPTKKETPARHQPKAAWKMSAITLSRHPITKYHRVLQQYRVQSRH